MNAIFYSFTKRPNSTKQPNPADGKNITCQLKEETSFLNPTIIIGKDNVSGVFSPALWNYVSIPYWQRYYYITDWQYLNGVWECQCQVDPLASFKAAIGNTSAYVLRADAEYDGKIIDGMYPITTNTSVVTTRIPQTFNRNTGCYVVGIICCADTIYRTGSVVYYAMDENQVNNLLKFLYSDSIFNLSNITSIEQGLYQAISNPGQYIVSCTWVPLKADLLTDHPLVTIDIGYWQGVSGVVGRVVSGGCFGNHNIIKLPTHPQAATRGSYLNYAPYTKHTLYFPPFGGVQIDTVFQNYGEYIDAYVTVDSFTGQGNLRISAVQNTSSPDITTAHVMTERTSLCGVPIQISSTGTDFFAGLTGLLSAGVSAASGNYAGAANGIISTGSGLTDQHQTSLGYNGSFLETFDMPVLVSEFFRIADEDRAEMGRPLCKIRTLKNIPGYIQCQDKDLPFSGTQTENEAINRFINQGFFYE